MLKKIWQSFVRWFRKLFGRGTSRSNLQASGYTNELTPNTQLPPLDDTDREYLFMQLLEGVAHGWQQPRAIGFFNKIRQRVRKSEWLEWLDRFGNNLLNAPVPNYELAGRMVQLGQLDCGEIGDLASEYGERLLNRQAEEFPTEFLPIMEFDDSGLLAADPNRQFGDVPLELLIDNDPMSSPPPRSFAHQVEEEDPAAETREITLEEFSAMLYKDPNLVAELAAQFNIETTDPQVIINAVISQMQQQVQQISGDLTPITADPVTPEILPQLQLEILPPAAEIQQTTTEIPSSTTPAEIPPLTPSTSIDPTPTHKQVPPPPPVPKLEYKSEDPWSNNLLDNNESARPETVNTTDRGV
jgi:hypothetical protein